MKKLALVLSVLSLLSGPCFASGGKYRARNANHRLRLRQRSVAMLGADIIHESDDYHDIGRHRQRFDCGQLGIYLHSSSANKWTVFAIFECPLFDNQCCSGPSINEHR